MSNEINDLIVQAKSCLCRFGRDEGTLPTDVVDVLHGIARLRGEAAQGEQQAVAWIRFRSDGLYEGPIHDSRMEDVRRRSGAWTPLYTRPQPAAVAGDAVRALRELRDEALRGSFADTLSGDHDAVKRMLRRIADQCEAALSAAPAAPDMPPPGTPFVGCQCPTCGEEFVASAAPGRETDWNMREILSRAAPAPVAGDAVAKLLRVWETPPTKAGPGWIESNARRDCARQMRAALAQDRASQGGAVPDAVDFWVCPDCDHYYMTDGVTCDCHGRATQNRMRHIRMAPLATAPTPGAEGKVR